MRRLHFRAGGKQEYATSMGQCNRHHQSTHGCKSINQWLPKCLLETNYKGINSKTQVRNKEAKALTISQWQESSLQHKKQRVVFLRPQDSIHHGASEQHHKESTMFFASFTMLSPRFIIIFKCCLASAVKLSRCKTGLSATGIVPQGAPLHPQLAPQAEALGSQLDAWEEQLSPVLR